MSKQRYLSYMLRLWETTNGESHVWRASLESPGSGQRRGFVSLQSLMVFLEAEMRSDGEQSHDPYAPGEADDRRPR